MKQIFSKQLSKQLEKLNIFSVRDLLLHLPSKYQDRTRVSFIRHVKAGDEVVIDGVITAVYPSKHARTKLLCQFKDETGSLWLRFFHVMRFQEAMLKTGKKLRCYGEVRFGAKGLEIIHPEYQVINDHDTLPEVKHLTPFYPSTQGLSQNKLRKLIAGHLEDLKKSTALKELLPQHLMKESMLPSYEEALYFLHNPPKEANIHALEARVTPAHKKLVFEELLAHRLSLLTLKQEFQSQKAMALPDHGHSEKFLKTLPFSLTSAQLRVLAEIKKDLQSTKPMLRLLQGDVGSGKTIVALIAMLLAVQNGYQAVLMAPTELLAFQHLQVFKRFLANTSLPILFLTSSLKAKEKKNALQAIKEGSAQIILGTHALFQEKVQFKNLALIVIDEQHRFGVEQRLMLRQKGMFKECFPHQLVMTATPIPRTLAMSCYADLDSSLIDELPAGRTPVITRVVPNTRRDEVILRIKQACKEGRQVYWVCPFIEESEIINCQAAVKTAETLKTLLPELTIVLLHGRMSSEEREAVMDLFKNNEAQLLVATTIIEVGVDVPNASLMIIENAERLGLSQLHQLRGRVGRGALQSHCLLLYQTPLSELAQARLSVLRETTDGFKIAQRDLEIRGPGEVLGTRQTGSLTFRIADLQRDAELLQKTVSAADKMLDEHTDLIPDLIERWVGSSKTYGTI